MSKQIVSEYRQGRQRNFFLRENEGLYFLEKLTQSCGYTVKAGYEHTIVKYLEDNGFKLVGVIAWDGVTPLYKVNKY